MLPMKGVLPELPQQAVFMNHSQENVGLRVESPGHIDSA